jgi:hypothetical protein
MIGACGCASRIVLGTADETLADDASADHASANDGNANDGNANDANAAGDGDGPPTSCNPLLVCGQALTCVNGELYPTNCGPSNCDNPIGTCPDGG